MKFARRLAPALAVGVLLALVGLGVAWGLRPDGPLSSAHQSRPPTPSATAPVTAPTHTATTTPTTPPPTTPTTTPSEPATPTQTTPVEPAQPAPGPTLLKAGDQSEEVRDLQARLRQIDWFNTDVTGLYGPVTAEAVRGFQAKRGFAVTGDVDQRTLDRLHEMTTVPTADELANRFGLDVNVPGPLDPRCKTGRAICVDKTSQTLRWVVAGQVLKTLDVRFGAEYTPTREGTFSVLSKYADYVSHLYGSAMPYSMFFSGGQAVHFSSDFLARGYAGASHGCVNVRDYDGVHWLFDHARVGDPVIVYRS